MRKTAIVTGGSRGIGFGIALELAKHGYNIAILDVNDLEDPSRPDYKENMAKLEAAGAEYLYQIDEMRRALATKKRKQKLSEILLPLPGFRTGKTWKKVTIFSKICVQFP